jgi:thiamine kinase-like enzyme
MPERQEHLQEVNDYLQKHFSACDWTLSFPRGSGKETYFAQGNEHKYFVKVGAPLENYLAMAEIGLTPPILSSGQLESGAAILVQPWIAGRMPSRLDFQSQLEKVAGLIHTMHNDPRLQNGLSPSGSNLHQGAGQQAFQHLLQKWERYKSQVPKVSSFVDDSLAELTLEIRQFRTKGLAASHNDICNANWLFTSDGKIYIIDLDSMSLDDPALDMGALLWWYYPPEMRGRFLKIAAYSYDDEFKRRMRVRMAIHCLNILLPREQSFDDFEPGLFSESLIDFRAVFAGQENPQGYIR